MVKGVAGLVAPGVIGLALLLDKRFIVAVRSRDFWQSLLLAVVIIAPWHIYVFMQHGRDFLAEYIGYHVIKRATTVIEYSDSGKFYYVESLRKNFFPWFYLAPFALALSLRENIKNQTRSRILLLTILIVGGIYTVAQTKLSWYVLPLYPALAILIASTVRRAITSPASIAFGGLAVATVTIALLIPVKMLLIFGAVSLPVILFCLATGRRPFQAIAVVACVLFVTVGLREVRSVFSPKNEPLARLAQLAGSSGVDDRESMILFPVPMPDIEFYRPQPLFYSNRPIQEAHNLEDVARFTEGHQMKRIIVAETFIENLSPFYEVDVLAQEESFVYATITPHKPL